MTDRKPQDVAPPSGQRPIPANELAYPYRECPGGGESLQALVGLCIGAGWSGEVRKRLPSGETCAHLREILGENTDHSRRGRCRTFGTCHAERAVM
uniref:Uncharacterized protein n=1 Tax=Cupriavidus pinatubonensis (strain JMP 134 / LMG 1197) TaxID=264198 RepID=Q46PD2_CUPPJ